MQEFTGSLVISSSQSAVKTGRLFASRSCSHRKQRSPSALRNSPSRNRESSRRAKRFRGVVVNGREPRMRKTVLLASVRVHLQGVTTEQEIDRLADIKPVGMFIKDSTLPGETRKDDVVPRHAVCIQVAKMRWLIVYYTHGFRGVDDERSILYQLRRDAPDGEVIKEGFLARVNADWRPDGVPAPPPGKTYFKQHGHAVAFGVPKGAIVDGKPAPNANVFVAQWRVLGRRLIAKEDRLERAANDPVLMAKTQDVEWVQFRLNDREVDLEILQAITQLRPKGDGKLPSASMNQSFCPPVPFNKSASEWVVCNHFDKGRLAGLKFRFDPGSKRYEWVETSPFLADPKRPLSEASIVRQAD